jgi:hypothetical protein
MVAEPITRVAWRAEFSCETLLRCSPSSEFADAEQGRLSSDRNSRVLAHIGDAVSVSICSTMGRRGRMTFETLSLSQRIKRCREFCAPYRVTGGDKFALKKFDPDDIGGLEG